MSTYKITITKDFHNEEEKEIITLSNVTMSVKKDRLVFIDLITGDEVESFPRKQVLHAIKIS